MTSSTSNLKWLAEAVLRSDDYPRNLFRSHQLPHSLDTYQKLLHQRANDVFRGTPLDFYIGDVESDDHGVPQYHETSIQDSDCLKAFLAPVKRDPHHRIISLQSATSRDPIGCSREQMTLILSSHQIMAPFIDFILTFKRRQDPHRLAALRCEDHLDASFRLPGLKVPSRSGFRIEHCFNVLGIEERKGACVPRQIAAYHSFDVREGRTVWVVMKGNSRIRERLGGAIQDAVMTRPKFPFSVSESFGQALRDHLAILQWCAEEWEPYLECMETKCRKASVITRYGGVLDLAEDAPKWRDQVRADSFAQSERQASAPAGLFSLTGWRAGLTTKESTKGPTKLARCHTSSSTATPSRQHSFNNSSLKLNNREMFENLQKLRDHASEIQERMSILDQSTRVIESIRTRYHSLVRAGQFTQQMSKEQAKLCRQHSDDFEDQTLLIKSSLESFKARLGTIHSGTEHSGEMFNYIFQISSTCVSEHFAASNRDSADLMELWTEQMHQKTVSMHFITLLTLVFLPMTFVATFFSSGILTFGEEGQPGFGSNLGDWEIRIAGLKLFMIVSLPLMILALNVWFWAYRSSRRSIRLKKSSRECV